MQLVRDLDGKQNWINDLSAATKRDSSERR